MIERVPLSESESAKNSKHLINRVLHGAQINFIYQLTNKRINKIEASYTLEGTVLENVDSIKYLGVTITNDLKWNTLY